MTGAELGSRYTMEELREMLGAVGENVSLNRSVVLYGAKNIHLGSNVRIDCFCVLSAGSPGILIGDYVHIAAYTALFGSGVKSSWILSQAFHRGYRYIREPRITWKGF